MYITANFHAKMTDSFMLNCHAVHYTIHVCWGWPWGNTMIVYYYPQTAEILAISTLPPFAPSNKG